MAEDSGGRARCLQIVNLWLEVRCAWWIIVNVAASLAAAAAFIVIARALSLRWRASSSNTTCNASGSDREPLAQLAPYTSVVCTTRLKLFVCSFLGYKSASIFGRRMQPTTHIPSRRRALALSPRLCASGSNATCIAPRCDREPLAPDYSAHFNSVRHQVEIRVVCFVVYKNGVLFWTKNATRHAQTYAQTYAGFAPKVCASVSNTTCTAPMSDRPLTAHTSIVCVIRLKLFWCPFLGYKTASSFERRIKPTTHKPTRRRAHTEAQHHRRTEERSRAFNARSQHMLQ